MKALVSCKKCGKLTEVDTSKVLTSNPPQYNYICESCGERGYCFTHEVTWCISSEQNKEDVCVSKVSVLESTKEELAKYKKAFEILKDRLTFVVYESPNIPSTYFLLAEREKIEEEEVELIEELMKDA